MGRTLLIEAEAGKENKSKNTYGQTRGIINS